MKILAPRISALIEFLMKLTSLAGLTRGIGKTPLQLELFQTEEPPASARKPLRREDGFYL
jgi:hypothetical protein